MSNPRCDFAVGDGHVCKRKWKHAGSHHMVRDGWPPMTRDRLAELIVVSDDEIGPAYNELLEAVRELLDERDAQREMKRA